MYLVTSTRVCTLANEADFANRPQGDAWGVLWARAGSRAWERRRVGAVQDCVWQVKEVCDA